MDNVDIVKQTIELMKGQVSEFSVITSYFKLAITDRTFRRQIRSMMPKNEKFNITYDCIGHRWTLPHIMRLGVEGAQRIFSFIIYPIPDLGIYEWFKNRFEGLSNRIKSIEDKFRRWNQG